MNRSSASASMLSSSKTVSLWDRMKAAATRISSLESMPNATYTASYHWEEALFQWVGYLPRSKYWRRGDLNCRPELQGPNACTLVGNKVLRKNWWTYGGAPGT